MGPSIPCFRPSALDEGGAHFSHTVLRGEWEVASKVLGVVAALDVIGDIFDGSQPSFGCTGWPAGYGVTDSCTCPQYRNT
jgi:hypothetical protein